jgi:hypothetical protein
MNRRGLWIGATLLLAGVIFWAVGQAVNPSDGDTELKNTLEAIKHVKSFRGAYLDSASHSERLWEVDCDKVIVHQQSHASLQAGMQAGSDPASEMKEDVFLVGENRFVRDQNGSWENEGAVGPRFSAKWYCDNIARGTVRDLLPDLYTMVGHAMTERGDKKTVNGARCRDWKFDIKTPLSSQKGSMCIGMDDHLPYELTMENGGHYSYSDYNRPIQFDAPDAVLQTASSTSESN